MCLFRTTAIMSKQETSCTHEASNKQYVSSNNAMSVSIDLKSDVRYKFVNLVTYHPDSSHLREKRCEDPPLFCEVRKGLRTKKFGKHCHKVQFVAIAFPTWVSEPFKAQWLSYWNADKVRSQTHHFSALNQSATCSVNQKIYQAPLLQKFKNQVFRNVQFFISGISLLFYYLLK